MQAGEIGLAIHDDGVGLAAGYRTGMGFQNMKARAGMMGAGLDIRAGASGGTVVTCLLTTPNGQARSG